MPNSVRPGQVNWVETGDVVVAVDKLLFPLLVLEAGGFRLVVGRLEYIGGQMSGWRGCGREEAARCGMPALRGGFAVSRKADFPVSEVGLASSLSSFEIILTLYLHYYGDKTLFRE